MIINRPTRSGFKNLTTYSEELRLIRRVIELLKNYCTQTGKDSKIYNQAVCRLFYNTPISALLLIEGNDVEVRFRNHKRDKKGKLIDVEAYLLKK